MALASRILVTGGAGFIGSAVVRHLISNSDAHVHVVDALTYAGNISSLESVSSNERYSLAQVDICDGKKIAQEIQNFKPDAIMHLAAESHVDRSIDGPGSFIETNIVGTYSMLSASLDYWQSLEGETKEKFRFLHISTDEVFGSLGAEGYFREDTSYDPRSPYSASKAGADHLVSAWYHTYGLPTVTTNCSNNYGPYHLPEKLIPLMIIKCLAGEKLPVYGDGSNIRDWLFVEDHVTALLAALTDGNVGESYMVGGNSERTNLQVVEAICDSLDKVRPNPNGKSYREQIHFVTDRPGHDFRYAIDATKIKDDLGWEPQHDFETGMQNTVDWYLANESWWRDIWTANNLGERLGSI